MKICMARKKALQISTRCGLGFKTAFKTSSLYVYCSTLLICAGSVIASSYTY